MSTRRAKDASSFHQNRYASSPEFERGLLANLVAKRCALVDDPAARELIWFVQFLSHQNGGLAALAKELRAKYPDRIQTREMIEMNLKPGKVCNMDQVRKLRTAFGECKYPLKGEVVDYFLGGHAVVSVSKCFSDADLDCSEKKWESDRDAAAKNPASYLSDDFFNDCLELAEKNLEKTLWEICLDPAKKIADCAPRYFPRLIESLNEYKLEFVKGKSAGAVITALGQKVCEVLDYTFYSRGLTLMQGEARTGKTFAARVWSDQRPGLARFVEVPASNDDASFFRALARGLGLGNFLKYKVAEIRERVESVLLTRDILLVLDESQRLWPQRNLRYGFPSRIVWVMTMANAGVPIAMVSTPQFIQAQKAIEKTGWNSAQLTGRISHFEALPVDLSLADLIAVAKSVLPEADAQVLRALAIYARSSARYLAAIDSISKRARYIAMQAGRAMTSTDDVRKAMQESVIPADSKLTLALANGRKQKQIEPVSAPVEPDSSELESPEDSDFAVHHRADRGLTPIAASRRSGADKAVLIGH